jgi:hypothetical protein
MANPPKQIPIIIILSPGKVPGAASELAAGSIRERTPATGGLIFLSLLIKRKQK